MRTGRRREGQLKLLLVEDNPADAYLLTRHADNSSAPQLELTHVERISEAVDRLSGHAQFDAVLLDLGLPDSSGVESVRQVVQTRPDIPIVVLTNLDNPEAGLRAVQLGAEDYLVKKTFDGPAITRVIQYAIERSRTRNQLEQISAHITDGIVVIGGDHSIRYRNQAARGLFGDAIDQASFTLPLDGLSSDIEITEDNGDRRFCEVRVSAFEWGGEPARLASIRDVTDRRRALALARERLQTSRLAAVRRLAAGAAHELNNPLTVLTTNLLSIADVADRLYAELSGSSASEDALAALDEARAMIEECTAGANQIGGFARELGSFSQISVDATEELDINAVIESACHLTAPELVGRAQLTTELSASHRIIGDRAKLTDVFINLLVNAAEAIDPGDAETDWIRVQTLDRGEAVVIQITDSGAGIAEADLDQVFEPFFTRSRHPQSAGLGLSIAAETVREHRGRIELASVVGEGTKIAVTLPSAEHAPMRLLVIADDTTLLRSMQRVLGLHHHVITAIGGRRGLEVLAANPEGFDGVVCDVALREIDGAEIYREIAERHPELAGGVIFQTDGKADREIHRFFRDHDLQILEKPASARDLYAAVRSIGRRGDR